MIKFFIPGDPVGKERPRATSASGCVRMYTPPKTAAYEEQVKLCARAAMAGKAPLAGAVSIRLNIGLKVPKSVSKRLQMSMLSSGTHPCKKPDIDNVIKAVCDACNGITYEDDKQIVAVEAVKSYMEETGVAVEMAEMGEGNHDQNSKA